MLQPLWPTNSRRGATSALMASRPPAGSIYRAPISVGSSTVGGRNWSTTAATPSTPQGLLLTERCSVTRGFRPQAESTSLALTLVANSSLQDATSPMLASATTAPSGRKGSPLAEG